MKVFRSLLVALAALFLSSCYYDSWGVSSGGGYGYGGSTLIYTSNSRWAYDPYVRCYYDYDRRCYYDPYLGSYYRPGYCPRPVYGVPHPYGWNGRGTCPLPRNVNSRTIKSDYNRVAQLQKQFPSSGRSIKVRNDANVATWQANRLNTVAQAPARSSNQATTRGTGTTRTPNVGRPGYPPQINQDRSPNSRGTRGQSMPGSQPPGSNRGSARSAPSGPTRSAAPPSGSQRAPANQSVSTRQAAPAPQPTRGKSSQPAPRRASNARQSSPPDQAGSASRRGRR